MLEFIQALVVIAKTVVKYWIFLFQTVFLNTPYSGCTLFAKDTHARVQLFSLSLIFKLWKEKHYRSKSFQEDSLDNLRNVAIPGTGIPLSYFCVHELFALIFIFCINPTICFFGSANEARINSSSFIEFSANLQHFFAKNLLHPDDWFSLWRMNCRLVSYHSLVTGSDHYKMEDKWTFLTKGKELSIPISPYLDNVEAIVCKNKLIEGGMGIHFFANAAFDGDWIIQEKLKNAPWLDTLLPGNAPLSTMRVITTSSYTLSEEYPVKKEESLLSQSSLRIQEEDAMDEAKLNLTPPATTSPTQQASSQQQAEDVQRYIRAESAVLRLGRQNALTDHSSILFDVNMQTGIIQPGCSNSHWYQLGVEKALQTSWLPSVTGVKQHLDSPFPIVSGKMVPEMKEALDIVTK